MERSLFFYTGEPSSLAHYTQGLTAIEFSFFGTVICLITMGALQMIGIIR
jgi:hypothetical protein